MADHYVPRSPLPNHDGTDGDPAGDYFVAPSAEIGDVISAGTTHTSAGPRAITSRAAQQRWIEVLAWGIGLGVIVGAAAYAAGDFGFAHVVPTTAAILGVGAGCVASVAVMIGQALPRGFSSYVGRLGCQSFRTGPTGSALEICRFEECDGVTSSVIEEHENGVYRLTRYRYELARRGKRPLVIAGSYHRDDEDLGSPSRFARAAEDAWIAHRWPTLDARLGAGEAVSFDAGPFRIDVRRTGLEIHRGARSVVVARDEIAAVSSAQGWLVMKKRGSEGYSPSVLFTRKRGWVESGSVFQIAEPEIRDLPLLVRALETHLGLAAYYTRAP